MLELIVGRDLPGAPAMSLWFSLPAVAILVAPLLARRRFPFAAPVAYWLIAAGLTYVNGLLIPFIGSLGVVGLASAFLLGNLRDERKAGIGLAIVVDRSWSWSRTSRGHSRPATWSSSRFGSSSPGSRDTRCVSAHSRPRRPRCGQPGRGEREAAEMRAMLAERSERPPPDRGGGGASADSPRAARHRRACRQRDGASGRRSQAQAARCRGRGPRCSRRASSGQVARRSPRCASCWERCAATVTAST